MSQMPVYYSADYTAAKYAFDTTRKSAAVARLIEPLVDLRVPDVTDFDLTRIHDPSYVRAVQTGTPEMLASSQGFNWDPGIFTMARAHVNGLISAVADVLDPTTTVRRAGSLSSGLHHAERMFGNGFCTFNGLAAAATYALEDMGAERVLVLDFDAHCGGGTMDIMGGVPGFVQWDISVSPYDGYTPTGEHRQWMSKGGSYIPDVVDMLADLRYEKFDLIVYNAGVDPINCGVSAREVFLREALVSDLIGDTPAIFALAGGYTWNVTMGELAGLHEATVREWALY
ncbi:MAG: hypothetical protein ACOYOQ_00550 [Microthrixaceae bacterium]